MSLGCTEKVERRGEGTASTAKNELRWDMKGTGQDATSQVIRNLPFMLEVPQVPATLAAEG